MGLPALGSLGVSQETGRDPLNSCRASRKPSHKPLSLPGLPETWVGSSYRRGLHLHQVTGGRPPLEACPAGMSTPEHCRGPPELWSSHGGEGEGVVTGGGRSGLLGSPNPVNRRGEHRARAGLGALPGLPCTWKLCSAGSLPQPRGCRVSLCPEQSHGSHAQRGPPAHKNHALDFRVSIAPS